MHKESVRAAVIQPGEEKVSRDPFAIFTGLMGGLQRRWTHNLLRGVQEEDERQHALQQGEILIKYTRENIFKKGYLPLDTFKPQLCFIALCNPIQL